MHIAILGSAFDPLTEAHLALGETVLDPRWGGQGPYGTPGALWLVPCPPRYDKSPKAPPERRYRWAQLGAQELNRRLGDPGRVAASDVELVLSAQAQGDAPGYVGYRGTLFLLRRLTRDHPDHRFSLVVGEDSIHALEQWKDPATQELTGAHLLREFPLYVAPRAGAQPLDLGARLARLGEWEPTIRAVVLPPLGGPLAQASSTALRAQLAQGLGGDGTLPPAIAEDLASQGNPYGPPTRP